MQRVKEIALLAFFAPLFAASAQTTEFHHLEATLSPSAENPAVTDRQAVGEARIGIRVDRDADGDIADAIVDFDLEVYVGQEEEFIALHIHQAPAGVNGGIVVSSGGLDFGMPSIEADAGSTRIFVQRLAQMDPSVLDAIDDILADPSGFYVNLHSTSNRPGIVRGQLRYSASAMLAMGAERAAANGEVLDALTEMVDSIGETVARIARRLGLVPASE